MQKYRERRRLTDREVRVRRGEDEAQAMLRDATPAGVRLVSKLPVEVGDEISISGFSFDAMGTVVWSRPDEFGVALTARLSPQVLQRLSGAAVRLNRQSRVGF